MNLTTEAGEHPAYHRGSPGDARLEEGFWLDRWLVLPSEGRIEGREGERHLEPRQIDLLLCLAAHSDRVVSKQELLDAVWDGVAIEEGALARTISEIRKALGDDARQPRFIQTVSKRGYRLIEPPRSREGSEAPVVVRRAGWLLGAAAVALLAITLLLLRGSEASRSADAVIRAGPAIVVLSFDNLTADADAGWYSTGIAEMLATELAASGVLRVVAGPPIAEPRRELMAGEPATASAPAVGGATSAAGLRRLRATLGVDYVVTGSFRFAAGEGRNRLHLDIRLMDSASGETVATVHQEGAATQVYHLASLASQHLLSKLDSDDPEQRYGEKVAALLPDDPAAARFYFEGLRRLQRQEATAAKELLEKSLDREARQPFAWLALSEACDLLGEETLARAAADEAHALAAELPREQKLWIEARWLAAAHRWHDAIEIYRALWLFAPENVELVLHLARAENEAGRPRQALETLERLRGQTSPGQTDPRLDLAAGASARLLGDPSAALAAAGRAAETAGRLGADLLVAHSRLLQAKSLRSLGRVAEATATIEEARTAFAAAGDRRSEAQAQITLAGWLYDQGDFERADHLAQSALDVFHQLGDRAGEARARIRLAGEAWSRGEQEEAESLFKEVIASHRALSDRAGEAGALRSYAIALASHGDLERAQPLFEQELAIHRATQADEGVAVALMNLGKLMLLRGDAVEAARRLGEAQPLMRRLRLRQHLATVQFNLGYAAGLGGETPTAEGAFREAADLYRQLENPRMEAASLTALGEVLTGTGSFNEARRVLEASLALRREIGEEARIGMSRCSLAALELEQGDLEAAQRQIQEALAVMKDKASELPLRLLARTLLAQGKPEEAQEAILRAGAQLPSGPSFDRLWFELVEAQVNAANRKTDLAVVQLSDLLERTAAQGVWGLNAEACLALGRIELRRGDLATGRSRLAALEAEARRRGWGHLANKARTLLAGEAAPAAVEG